jgi:hypothetical protein
MVISRLIFVLILTLCSAKLSYGYEPIGEYDLGFSLGIDVKQSSSNVDECNFKFQIVSPYGEVLGYDSAAGLWMGEYYYSEIDNPFCRPAKPDDKSINYEIKRPSFTMRYLIAPPMYCKNPDNDEEMFVPATYDIGVDTFSKTDAASFTLRIISSCNALIKVEYDPIVETHLERLDIPGIADPLITIDTIATPQYQPDLSIYYNFKDDNFSRIEKVVTPISLEEQWKGCNQLGFVKNQGIYNSINKKLLEAKQKYEAGNRKTASNIYNAAINEIKAQYGKGFSKECGDILLKDLQYLADKL